MRWAGNPAKMLKETKDLTSEITCIASAYSRSMSWFVEEEQSPGEE